MFFLQISDSHEVSNSISNPTTTTVNNIYKAGQLLIWSVMKFLVYNEINKGVYI